jgi:hypothetical protein
VLRCTSLIDIVRTDIHVAYDDDLWTFVPELKVLEMIERSLIRLIREAKKHCMDEVWHSAYY